MSWENNPGERTRPIHSMLGWPEYSKKAVRVTSLFKIPMAIATVFQQVTRQPKVCMAQISASNNSRAEIYQVVKGLQFIITTPENERLSTLKRDRKGPISQKELTSSKHQLLRDIHWCSGGVHPCNLLQSFKSTKFFQHPTFCERTSIDKSLRTQTIKVPAGVCTGELPQRSPCEPGLLILH